MFEEGPFGHKNGFSQQKTFLNVKGEPIGSI